MVGRDYAVFIAAPAKQRLGSNELFRMRIHNGLIKQEEALVIIHYRSPYEMELFQSVLILVVEVVAELNQIAVSALL